jgi:hypothetical protein
MVTCLEKMKVLSIDDQNISDAQMRSIAGDAGSLLSGPHQRRRSAASGFDTPGRHHR